MPHMWKSLIFIFVIIFTTASYGEFNPWNSDIKSGDSLNHKPDGARQSPGVFNGAQGGAYFLIKFFQVVISPQDGPNCRHIPTCSAYGKHAVVKHGALLGSFMAGERLLRCNPFYPPERDPVPEKAFAE